MSDASAITGIAWYQRHQWARLRQLSADADKLDDSYDEWLAGAHKVMIQLALDGVRTRRVDVDVDELARWCQRAGRRLDGAARSEFVAERLRSGPGQANSDRGGCP
jgi:hypothetical protein